MSHFRNAVRARKRRTIIWPATGDVVSVYVSLCCLLPFTTTLFFADRSLFMSYRWWHRRALALIAGVMVFWSSRCHVWNFNIPSFSFSSAWNHCVCSELPAFLKLVGLVMSLCGSLTSYCCMAWKLASAIALIYPFLVGVMELLSWMRWVVALFSWVRLYHSRTSLTEDFSSSFVLLLV